MDMDTFCNTLSPSKHRVVSKYEEATFRPGEEKDGHCVTQPLPMARQCKSVPEIHLLVKSGLLDLRICKPTQPPGLRYANTLARSESIGIEYQ